MNQSQSRSKELNSIIHRLLCVYLAISLAMGPTLISLSQAQASQAKAQVQDEIVIEGADAAESDDEDSALAELDYEINQNEAVLRDEIHSILAVMQSPTSLMNLANQPLKADETLRRLESKLREQRSRVEQLLAAPTEGDAQIAAKQLHIGKYLGLVQELVLLRGIFGEKSTDRAWLRDHGISVRFTTLWEASGFGAYQPALMKRDLVIYPYTHADSTIVGDPDTLAAIPDTFTRNEIAKMPHRITLTLNPTIVAGLHAHAQANMRTPEGLLSVLKYVVSVTLYQKLQDALRIISQTRSFPPLSNATERSVPYLAQIHKGFEESLERKREQDARMLLAEYYPFHAVTLSAPADIFLKMAGAREAALASRQSGFQLFSLQGVKAKLLSLGGADEEADETDEPSALERLTDARFLSARDAHKVITSMDRSEAAQVLFVQPALLERLAKATGFSLEKLSSRIKDLQALEILNTAHTLVEVLQHWPLPSAHLGQAQVSAGLKEALGYAKQLAVTGLLRDIGLDYESDEFQEAMAAYQLEYQARIPDAFIERWLKAGYWDSPGSQADRIMEQAVETLTVRALQLHQVLETPDDRFIVQLPTLIDTLEDSFAGLGSPEAAQVLKGLKNYSSFASARRRVTNVLHQIGERAFGKGSILIVDGKTFRIPGQLGYAGTGKALSRGENAPRAVTLNTTPAYENVASLTLEQKRWALMALALERGAERLGLFAIDEERAYLGGSRKYVLEPATFTELKLDKEIRKLYRKTLQNQSLEQPMLSYAGPETEGKPLYLHIVPIVQNHFARIEKLLPKKKTREEDDYEPRYAQMIPNLNLSLPASASAATNLTEAASQAQTAQMGQTPSRRSLIQAQQGPAAVGDSSEADSEKRLAAREERKRQETAKLDAEAREEEKEEALQKKHQDELIRKLKPLVVAAAEHALESIQQKLKVADKVQNWEDVIREGMLTTLASRTLMSEFSEFDMQRLALISQIGAYIRGNDFLRKANEHLLRPLHYMIYAMVGYWVTRGGSRLFGGAGRVTHAVGNLYRQSAPHSQAYLTLTLPLLFTSIGSNYGEWGRADEARGVAFSWFESSTTAAGNFYLHSEFDGFDANTRRARNQFLMSVAPLGIILGLGVAYYGYRGFVGIAKEIRLRSALRKLGLQRIPHDTHKIVEISEGKLALLRTEAQALRAQNTARRLEVFNLRKPPELKAAELELASTQQRLNEISEAGSLVESTLASRAALRTERMAQLKKAGVDISGVTGGGTQALAALEGQPALQGELLIATRRFFNHEETILKGLEPWLQALGKTRAEIVWNVQWLKTTVRNLKAPLESRASALKDQVAALTTKHADTLKQIQADLAEWELGQYTFKRLTSLEAEALRVEQAGKVLLTTLRDVHTFKMRVFSESKMDFAALRIAPGEETLQIEVLKKKLMDIQAEAKLAKLFGAEGKTLEVYETTAWRAEQAYKRLERVIQTKYQEIRPAPHAWAYSQVRDNRFGNFLLGRRNRPRPNPVLHSIFDAVLRDGKRLGKQAKVNEHYERLGLEPQAPLAEVEEAFMRIAQQWRHHSSAEQHQAVLDAYESYQIIKLGIRQGGKAGPK